MFVNSLAYSVHQNTQKLEKESNCVTETIAILEDTCNILKIRQETDFFLCQLQKL